jgi:hypothetical protein
VSCGFDGEFCQAVALEKECADLERLLCDLLAVIHRDGGHYVAKHGLIKACADAEVIVAKMHQAVPGNEINLSAMTRRRSKPIRR